jgi:hypothetical protein
MPVKAACKLVCFGIAAKRKVPVSRDSITLSFLKSTYLFFLAAFLAAFFFGAAFLAAFFFVAMFFKFNG